MFYLNLYFHISTFNKIYRCLEELIKTAYDPLYKPFWAYFNKLYGKFYIKKSSKQLIRRLKFVILMMLTLIVDADYHVL